MGTVISCEHGEHTRVVQDKWALDFGGRAVPGDCVCLDCQEALPAWWNKGNPVAIQEKTE
jgi:hypothetical protein